MSFGVAVLLGSCYSAVRTPLSSGAKQRGRKKLPSAEKIVDNHLKAIGGKKRLAAIRDATREWTIQLNDQPIGTAKTQTKAPASLRSEMTIR